MEIKQFGIANLAIVALFLVRPAVGQPSTVPPLTFEVASVKVATSGDGWRGSCRGIDDSTRTGPNETPAPLGRCVIRSARLGHLISIAFGVSTQDLKTGPDWTEQMRFDVDARAEDPAKTTQKQLLTMLQNLLVERFHMKFHYQTGAAPGFSLNVAKGGPKLQESTSDDVKMIFTGPQGETLFKPTGQAISLTAKRCSMAMLANLLTAIGQSGPTVDKTGLSGNYDFKLSWDNEEGPALSTALGQLGLQMKTEKVPVSVFVVDSAEKLASN